MLSINPEADLRLNDRLDMARRGATEFLFYDLDDVVTSEDDMEKPFSKHIRLYNTLISSTNVVPSEFLHHFLNYFDLKKDYEHQFKQWVIANEGKISKIRDLYFKNKYRYTPDELKEINEKLIQKVLGLNITGSPCKFPKQLKKM